MLLLFTHVLKKYCKLLFLFLQMYMFLDFCFPLPYWGINDHCVTRHRGPMWASNRRLPGYKSCTLTIQPNFWTIHTIFCVWKWFEREFKLQHSTKCRDTLCTVPSKIKGSGSCLVWTDRMMCNFLVWPFSQRILNAAQSGQNELK